MNRVLLLGRDVLFSGGDKSSMFASGVDTAGLVNGVNERRVADAVPGGRW